MLEAAGPDWDVKDLDLEIRRLNTATRALYLALDRTRCRETAFRRTLDVVLFVEDTRSWLRDVAEWIDDVPASESGAATGVHDGTCHCSAAVRMRAEGNTLADIAVTLGLPGPDAANTLVLQAVGRRVQVVAKRYRHSRLQHLEQLHRDPWHRMTRQPRVDVLAIKRVVELIAERSRLRGVGVGATITGVFAKGSQRAARQPNTEPPRTAPGVPPVGDPKHASRPASAGYPQV